MKTPAQQRLIVTLLMTIRSTYMREQGCPTHFPDQFPDRSPKTLRYVRKGIPPAMRGAAWFYYSKGAKLLQDNPRTYSSLLSRCKTSELSSNDIESIERDLHRTFPDNIHFKPDQRASHGSETPLLSSLRRLLKPLPSIAHKSATVSL